MAELTWKQVVQWVKSDPSMHRLQVLAEDLNAGTARKKENLAKLVVDHINGKFNADAKAPVWVQHLIAKSVQHSPREDSWWEEPVLGQPTEAKSPSWLDQFVAGLRGQ